MSHEFDGKQYDKASAHQKEWGSRLISELNPNGSERILDLGCGDGTLTAHLAGLVLGIDASRGMIEAALPKTRGNLRFRKMDINELDAESSGLCNVRVWGENADRYFPDEEAMVAWIDQPSLVPFLAALPVAGIGEETISGHRGQGNDFADKKGGREVF